MLTEAQKIEMPQYFLQLYEAAKTDEALSYLRGNWLIYPHLPNWVFDNEQISEVAISRHSYMSWQMSERLQRDIRFFEKVFNQFSPYAKIELKAGRDAFFMLAYANGVHGYTKAATKSDVSELFQTQDIEDEFLLAQKLVAKTKTWREWQFGDKEKNAQQLSTEVPGLEWFSYEYAYYWGVKNSANDLRAEYW